jgi:hypothetical protein
MSSSTGRSRTIKKEFTAPAILAKNILWTCEVIANFREDNLLDNVFVSIAQNDTSTSQIRKKVDVTLKHSDNKIELYVTEGRMTDEGFIESDNKFTIETSEGFGELDIFKPELYANLTDFDDVFSLLRRIAYRLADYYDLNVKDVIIHYLWGGYEVSKHAYVIFGKDDAVESALLSTYHPGHKVWLDVSISIMKGVEMLVEIEEVEGYSRKISKYKITADGGIFDREYFTRKYLDMIEETEPEKLTLEVIDLVVEKISGFIAHYLKDVMTFEF